MNNSLIIVGTGDYAEMAFYYLTILKTNPVIGFSEESSFIQKKDFKGLPIFKFELLHELFNPLEVKILVAVGPNRVNTVRSRLYEQAKFRGFSFIRFIHPDAYVWNEEAIGENSFIFPGCIVEPYATVGNNCVMWSGSILAHHSRIEDHCFVAPGCTISGRTVIKKNCFLGINSTIRDNIIVEERCIIGGGAVIKKDTKIEGVYSTSATPLYNYQSLNTKV